MIYRRVPVTNKDDSSHAARPGGSSAAEARVEEENRPPEEAGRGSAPQDSRPTAGSPGDGGPGSARPGAAGQDAAEAPAPAGEAQAAGAADRASSEVASLRDQLLRLAAEFDNYRKRESRERAEAWGRAKADLIEKLLAPIDDLSRVAHPEGPEAAPDSPVAGLLAGVELVERKLLQTLEREGLRRIEAEGAAFDPALHEAIMIQRTSDPELDGRVAHVALPGYRFGDRLLRPAKVVVWKIQP